MTILNTGISVTKRCTYDASSGSRGRCEVSAVTSALKSVSLELLAEHMSHCVVRAAQAGGQEAEDKISEANQAIARLVKA